MYAFQLIFLEIIYVFSKLYISFVYTCNIFILETKIKISDIVAELQEETKIINVLLQYLSSNCLHNTF